MLLKPRGMSLNLKQGSSLLDNEDSSSMGDFQSSAAISGDAAVSDHDTGEESDEYYEEEDDDCDDDDEHNDEERAPSEEKDDIDPFSVNPVEDHNTEETDDALSSSAVASDPRMNILSNFLKMSPAHEKTAVSGERCVSSETPVSPSASEATPAPQLILKEPETHTSEGISQAEKHNTFSDDDCEFFSAYLNERDERKDFEYASRGSFDDAPPATTPGTIYEQDADDEIDDEDVFKPTIPIEEQFLMQEKRAARSRSTTFLPRISDSKNVAEYSSRSLPPSFAGALANTNEDHKKPPTPQPRALPPVLSVDFPPQNYSFASTRKDLEKEGNEDSIVCNPSYTSELETPPELISEAAVCNPSYTSELETPPGLMSEAGAAATSKMIMSQAESNADKLKRMVFAIKVRMLKEETKGLHCNKLVGILFGEDDDNLQMPSLEVRKKLKKAIDIELTVKRFKDYEAVVDINTAELFMRDKSALEDICRQQVMSNPLLSSLAYDNSISNKSTTKKITSESPLEDESVVGEKEAVATASITTQVILYQELTDIISSENTDPATRLTNKISLLKKILAYKIGSMCNLSKMLNLSSFIVRQAINTIGGSAAAERVLLHDGGSIYGTMGGDPSLSGEGIGFLFGTILGGVNSVIIRSCVSVARLAMTMGVPIVMLNWPQEFKASKDYDGILRESILKFKHTSNVSLSFILDSVFSIEEEEEETTSNTPAAAVSILTDKEKAKIIRDSINNHSDRDFFGSFFGDFYGHNSKKRREETLEIPVELLYQNATNVIEHKNRITDNMFSSVVEYLEENKILLSRILNKLITKASLAATMYYINSSSVKKNKKYNGALLKKMEGKTISTLAANRRGAVGSGLSSSSSRGRLRSMMPVITAPQKITSAKSSTYTRESNDSDFNNTDSDSNSHLISDYQKEAFKQWSEAQ